MFKRTERNYAFFSSNLYLALIFAIVSISWCFGIGLAGLYIFGAIIVLICATQKSIIGILPIIASATFLFDDIYAVQTPLYLGSIIAVFSVCFIAIGAFMIKNKIKPRFTTPLIGFILMFLASIFGGISENHFGTQQWLIGFGSSGAMLIAWFLFSSAFRDNDHQYFAKLLSVVVAILVLETWVYYARQPDMIQNMLHKSINLGWGISNNISLILLTTMPFLLYLATKTVSPAPYLVLFALACITMVFTFSRGCIIILAVAILPLAIITIIRSKNWKHTALIAVAIVLAIASIVFAMMDTRFREVILNMLGKGLGDSGRFDLWEQAIKDWLAGELFTGRGFAYGSALTGTFQFINWYHSAPLQMLSNLGIFGFLAFVVHVAQRYYFITVKRSSFTFFAFAGSFMTSLYGMIDVTYFTPYFLLTMIIVYLMTYNNTKYPQENNPLSL